MALGYKPGYGEAKLTFAQSNEAKAMSGAQ
jgi:hypothetical protein